MEQKRFLFIIYFLDCLEDTHRIIILLGCIDQCFHIFRKTWTAITDAGIQETVTDTIVGTDTFTYHIYIRTDNLTQVGNIVHKTDTGSQHGVRSIFGHLGRWHIHKNYTEIV